MSDDGEIRAHVERTCVELEPELRAFLLGILKDVHLAGDAFQQTALKAMQAAETARKETVRGWLFQIAFHEAISLRRTETRRSRLVNSSVWTGLRERQNDDSGLAEFISREKQIRIRKAVLKLTPAEQDVVYRRMTRGQSFAEIAQETGSPLGTVLSQMRRALLKLKQMSELKDLGDDE